METSGNVAEKSKIKVKKPSLYKVIMHNDDYTTMEFVLSVLVNIFKKDVGEANKIMMDVHKKGIGIAGIYTYDIAVTKVSRAMDLAKEEGFPFKLTIEKE
ncbi:ATP-dependent Clp protease adapter protein ClpS [Clostridium bornimense]|uniref:ATP-dependent Clp protease adapter protein ClpS n=1 Tax=Clostridium bornimense TaxID=1216932 RepID=W6RXB5_9CLOT|nr:ATP-dependent Clp protease adaptor ClpS [Clostridium bornimense]CDM68269.1 ATP-dependent Clp protease adapter protein ClpS [Clostridium bornimense]